MALILACNVKHVTLRKNVHFHARPDVCKILIDVEMIAAPKSWHLEIGDTTGSNKCQKAVQDVSNYRRRIVL